MAATSFDSKRSDIVTVEDVAGSKSPANFEYMDKDTSDVQTENWLNIKNILAMISLGSIYIASLGGLILLNSISADIATSLNAGSLSSWLPASLTLGGDVGYVVGGAASDLFGRRYFAVMSAVLLTVGAVVHATARDGPSVIAGGGVMGLGQGFAQVALYGISELVPKNRRAGTLAFLQFASCPYLAFVSIISHAMAVKISMGFRSVSWLVFAHSALGLVMVFFFYNPQAPLATATRSKKQVLAEFDWVVGPTLILAGITWVSEYGATDAHFLGPFLVGCAVIILLGIHQARYAKNPLLHPQLFRRMRTFTTLLIITFVGGMLFYSLVGFFPTYLQTVYGEGQIKSGVDNTPLSVGSLFGGIIGALALQRNWGSRNLLIIGNVVMTLFIALMAIPGVTGRPAALGISMVAGIGIGWPELLCIVLVGYSTPDEWIGFATGTLGLARLVGGTAGIAIYATVFTSKIKAILPVTVAEAALGLGLPASSLPELLGVLTGAITISPLKIPGVTYPILEAATAALHQSYLLAFRYVWYTAIPFGVLSIIAAICTKNLNDQATNQIVQHLDKGSPIRFHEHEHHASQTTVEEGMAR